MGGHSLGVAVATWLSMYFETKKESLRPNYVVTFGAPRLVASVGSNRCPRSLQTRTKAVRIVVGETISNWKTAFVPIPYVDAATMLPEPPMNFCFQSFQMDNHGRLMEKDNLWPNLAYVSVTNHLVGWDLHSSEKKYEPYLMKVREKKEANEPCYKGGVCDVTGLTMRSCRKCCHGDEYKHLVFMCKDEPCVGSGKRCDFSTTGIFVTSCRNCCN